MSISTVFLCVCVLACPEGQYGVECMQQCRCENAASCSPVDGTCTCTAGWTGQFCQLRMYSYLFIMIVTTIVYILRYVMSHSVCHERGRTSHSRSTASRPHYAVARRPPLVADPSTQPVQTLCTGFQLRTWDRAEIRIQEASLTDRYGHFCTELSLNTLPKQRVHSRIERQLASAASFQSYNNIT